MATTPNTNDEQFLAERGEVLETAKAMDAAGLVVGTAGNVSRRSGDGLITITATSTPYESMSLDHVVVVDYEGEPVVGDAVPSTEMLMHVALYRARPDVHSVIHAHSLYASALAVAGASVPPVIDEMVVYLGDSIQISDYAFPGTEELGERVAEALGERNAALIRNHGLVAVGATPAEALRNCEMAERIAHIYVLARTLGSAAEVPPEAVQQEMEVFRMKRTVEGHV